MSTTQAYGTYMFIGAVIFIGYVFVSAGNFVEPHGIHVEEIESIELPKGSKILKFANDKNSIHEDIIKEKQQEQQLKEQQLKEQQSKKQQPKDSEDVDDYSRQRRSPQLLIKIPKDTKSMNQKDDPRRMWSVLDLEEKEFDYSDSDDSAVQPKSARRLKSSRAKINLKRNRPRKLAIKTKETVDDKGQVQVDKVLPIALSQRKKGKRRRRRRKRVRVIRIQKEQNLSTKEKNILEQKLIRSFGENYTESKSYKEIVDKCSEYKTYKGRILFFDSSNYIESQPNLCGGDIHLLLAVHTRPYNFDRRELIRNTFGSMRYIKGKRIALAFFLGTSNDKNVNDRIRKEAKSYQDIVQRNYVEHYRNMTYKHLTVMDWIMEFCPNTGYLVKVDDDVFANIFQVVDYIDTFTPQTLYCTKTVGPKPQRRSGKWMLTYDEYPNTKFPPYCMGYAYLMKASLAKDLYWCSVYSKFLWIDDVLIGGLLPKKLGYELTKFIGGHDSAYLLPSHGSWKIADHMFLLGTRNELLPDVIRKIWRASLQYSY